MQLQPVTSDELQYRIKTTHKTFRIPITLESQILLIAKEEKSNVTAIFLSLVQRGLKQYIHKKGIFYCQLPDCKKQETNKKMHIVPVANEEFLVCDDCYFGEKYRSFVIEMIQQN